MIKELSSYNPNADVTLTVSEDITISYICKDPKGNILNKQTTTQLFIEPTDSCCNCSHNYMNEELDQEWCSYYDKACDDVGECNQWEDWSSQWDW